MNHRPQAWPWALGLLAVPAGGLTGTVLALWLGRLAATRLDERQVEILHTLAAPA